MSAVPSRGSSRTPSGPPDQPSPASKPPRVPSQALSSTAVLSRTPSRAPSAIPASSAGTSRTRPDGLSTVPEDDDNNERVLLSAVIPASSTGRPDTSLPPPTPLPPPSALPAASTLRSAYNDLEDVRRASLQSSYATLAPRERAEQDIWAKRKATEFAPCPFNFPWDRHETRPGYVCAGGAHFMSDAILAEGIPGLYITGNAHRELDGWGRKPPAQEKIPHGYFGPVRPVGVDRHGNFTYFRNKVDYDKSKAIDGALSDVLSWKY
ncbi:hypothetical protein F5X99DRAFT_431721 [Biscogniauxia marginata]|nr:hypothetical protein F5X99DRAFT_431721 [Biscogniauxia marginata]